MNTHCTVLAIFATASYRSASDDAGQGRHSQREHRSAAGNDRFGSTPSAVATGSYQPELIDNCSAVGWPSKTE